MEITNIATFENINKLDIEFITKHSSLHLLNALYQCQDFIIVNSNQSPNKGIFIGGDEGKGFYLYYEKTEYCK